MPDTGIRVSLTAACTEWRNAYVPVTEGNQTDMPAPKILLPLHRENVHLMHFTDQESLPHQAMAIAETKLMEVLHYV